MLWQLLILDFWLMSSALGGLQGLGSNGNAGVKWAGWTQRGIWRTSAPLFSLQIW